MKDEANKIKGPSLDDLKKQLEVLKAAPINGYVLVGFPLTKEGFIHFEKKINGYLPKEELPET